MCGPRISHSRKFRIEGMCGNVRNVRHYLQALIEQLLAAGPLAEAAGCVPAMARRLGPAAIGRSMLGCGPDDRFSYDDPESIGGGRDGIRAAEPRRRVLGPLREPRRGAGTSGRSV